MIELDGGQHYDNRGLETDRLRTAYLQRHVLEVLHFSNGCGQNLNGVLTTLLRWIEARPLTPTLSRREREQD
jgi:very-short-patch-repair endonuclease